jgi:serine/threonine protein kinase
MDESAIREAWATTLSKGADWNTLSAETAYRPEETLSGATLQGSEGGFHQDATVAGALGSGVAPTTAAPVEGSQETPFELLAELGRGGMGVVYRARQGSLDREVAVKKIIADRATEGACERFVAEGRVTGFLDHPNIVPVHEMGVTEGGDMFVAMKLVGGRSWMDALHPDEASASEPEGLLFHLRILLSVCNAMAFAHSRDVLHLDLKPENVMVGDFGEVLVMDWGLAVHTPVGGHRRTLDRSSIRSPWGSRTRPVTKRCVCGLGQPVARRQAARSGRALGHGADLGLGGTRQPPGRSHPGRAVHERARRAVRWRRRSDRDRCRGPSRGNVRRRDRRREVRDRRRRGRRRAARGSAQS